MTRETHMLCCCYKAGTGMRDERREHKVELMPIQSRLPACHAVACFSGWRTLATMLIFTFLGKGFSCRRQPWENEADVGAMQCLFLFRERNACWQQGQFSCLQNVFLLFRGD